MDTAKVPHLVLGCDFTSAPSKRKTITICRARLVGDQLRVEGIDQLTSFSEFESALQTPGPWVGGFDLPLGQPREFATSLETSDYQGLLWHAEGISKPQWVAECRSYRGDQGDQGQRELRRQTDTTTGACSPMKCFFTPVGRMFYEGAPRIARCGASVPAHGVVGDDRTILEVYPALAAIALADSRSYKSDLARGIRPEHRGVRERIVAGLQGANDYGIQVTGIDVASLVHEPGADRLDAILAALQAAWASLQPQYGIPVGVDPIEGWIVDPANRNLTKASNQQSRSRRRPRPA